MRRALVAVAACSTPNGTGTVAFSDPQGHVSLVDIASGDIAPLDLGVFGSLASSYDGAYVAYMGEDFVPKVNDLHGDLAVLPGALQAPR